MESILTKENVARFIEAKKLDKLIHAKCEEIVGKVAIEIQEIFKKGKYSIGIDIADGNKVVLILLINSTTPEKVELEYNILYNEADLLIALRNIKDVLYDIRKRSSEVIPILPWWKRIFA